MDTNASKTSRRAVLAGAGALAASAAVAQTAPPPAAAALPRVAITTAEGVITVEMAADKAPITSANFLRYVDARRFDGAGFYRAMKLLAEPITGLIQGGVKNDPAKAFAPIKHESTLQTGLSNRDGAISMARYDPGTATSEFFICLGDLSGLDAKGDGTGENAGFAAFGHVVDGLDVAKKILLSPVSPTAGESDNMKGQMLDPEITIVSARRV
jgi:peptidyl-prolyl cis-trans isomerase A (cyclophilin A)